ncbi:peptidase M16 domain protein [Alkaliphilus metalliredigens QYMF]|uniref:Peptidase M16 domain protein n=1 Tax=Alkaliphilus metalliredigens (strain QYMF) TaxID=293826 RepID=A6TRJ9_ALKMQ|nr:pitrilysin family protein [Alkaliphilus metalliredigens]ABR48817.1 peptidase M16 domain protein [Alkaliphilus metalliredigens QYMF]
MYKKYTLDNGLRIVTEHIPHVKSISIGLWIKAGSRNEDESNNGVSHFIEHMLFKGTENRSAKDIAEEIDGIGGQINAFTSKECTCYYAKVLDEHYELVLDVLADMFFKSKLDSLEIDKERSVIIEEISMYEDSPEDLAHDLLSQTIYSGNTLGLPILGTQKTLENIDKKSMKDYMENYYTPDNTVIAIAGNFEEKSLLQAIEKRFANWESQPHRSKQASEIKLNFEEKVKKKEIEQVHLCLGFQGTSLDSKNLYPLLVFNNILGGSMSSRLFQNIREEKGLAYSIYSYPSIYTDSGFLAIYAGMNPQQYSVVSELISQELSNLREKGLTETEFRKSKEQLKGNYILGLESTSGRMSSMGKSELLLGKIYSPKEVVDRINRIEIKNVLQVIEDSIGTNNICSATVRK